MVHVHLIFQPNIKTSDEYKRGERTEQLDDSPKTEFQVRGTFQERSTLTPLSFLYAVFLQLSFISSGPENSALTMSNLQAISLLKVLFSHATHSEFLV